MEMYDTRIDFPAVPNTKEVSGIIGTRSRQLSLPLR